MQRLQFGIQLAGACIITGQRGIHDGTNLFRRHVGGDGNDALVTGKNALASEIVVAADQVDPSAHSSEVFAIARERRRLFDPDDIRKFA